MVGPIVSAFLTGMQDNGVMATAKHFPGHGDTDTDSHLAMPVVDLSYQRLQSVELAPFRATVAAGVGAVMVAHIWYPALDLEALPASLSYNIVTGLLRNDIGYEGLIMTDALDMDAIDLSYTPERSALLAVKAGHDVIAIGAHVGLPSQAAAIQTVIDAVRRGDISEERIDASVRRILDAKMRFGLFDWQPLDPETTSRRIKLDEHAALVETMFRAGVTVVYDKSMTIPENVTLIYPATRPSILRECRALKASLQAIGVSEYPSDEQIALAQRAAAMSEKVVVFTTGVEGQFRLVQALPPEKTLVVSLMSPYDVLNFPDVAGYITTYSPLSPAISAVCGILFGNIQPRGRLPVSLP
jgi:beta-N-acetylhexosaminidase